MTEAQIVALIQKTLAEMLAAGCALSGRGGVGHT